MHYYYYPSASSIKISERAPMIIMMASLPFFCVTTKIHLTNPCLIIFCPTKINFVPDHRFENVEPKPERQRLFYIYIHTLIVITLFNVSERDFARTNAQISQWTLLSCQRSLRLMQPHFEIKIQKKNSI